MNGSRESYSGVVPTKRLNEGLGGPEEIVEKAADQEEHGRA
jgi:hypothetical protein